MGKWKWVLIIVLLALIGVAVYAGVAYYKVQQTANDVYSNADSASKSASQQIKAKKPISILLLGIDTGSDGRTDKGRSDTMMVATINPKTKKTTLMSIPRDTLASMKADGESSIQKINAAYQIGGSTTAKNTVKNLLNVPINYYLTINMGGMKDLVNAVGGVTVTSKYTFNFNGITITKGTHHLNGKQALTFARMRYQDPLGDYGRQLRQQQVIKAVAKKLLSANSLTNYQKVLNIVKKNIRTDISFGDMTAMAKSYRAAGNTIKSDQLQGQDATINGGSYQIASTKELNRVSKKLRNQLGLSAAKVTNKEVSMNKANPYFDGVNYTTYNVETDTSETDATGTEGTESSGTETTGTTGTQGNTQQNSSGPTATWSQNNSANQQGTNW
ncbi:LytR family transcriptional regulator [Loigolactobacillus backii]|uniref:LCP family protein n=1 Tax=Loigolactobacillus backii TaxID=375175 RepID=UPI000C1C9D0A|nr:LytR family transcriptional regulator [Loigolactobacillus backii]